MNFSHRRCLQIIFKSKVKPVFFLKYWITGNQYIKKEQKRDKQWLGIKQLLLYLH